MKKEYGRSMIEMLGVLAIIGVLSIGGLAGYTMAMNRHRANTLLDDASKCVVLVQTKTDSGTFPSTAVDCYGANDTGVLKKTAPITGAQITVGAGASTDKAKVTFTAGNAVLSAVGNRLGQTVGSSATSLEIADYK